MLLLWYKHWGYPPYTVHSTHTHTLFDMFSQNFSSLTQWIFIKSLMCLEKRSELYTPQAIPKQSDILIHIHRAMLRK